MKCLITILVVLFVPIDCRTIVPSNVNEALLRWTPGVPQVSQDLSSSSSTEPVDADPTPMTLAESESTLVENKTWDNSEEAKPFVVSQEGKLEKLPGEFIERTSSARDYDEGALLKQLKLVLKGLSSDSAGKSKDRMPKSKRNLQDLWDTAGMLDIYFQEEQGDGQHVKSRSQIPSTPFHGEHEKSTEDKEAKVTKNEAEILDDVLVEAQNQLGRIRKYFEILCRKHHSMPSTADSSKHNHDDSAASNLPERIPMI